MNAVNIGWQASQSMLLYKHFHKGPHYFGDNELEMAYKANHFFKLLI